MRADRRRTRSYVSLASERLRERTAFGRAAVALHADLRTRRVPLHWTGLFGVVTLASIAVLFVTGVLLMLVYVPSSAPRVYQGPYLPLVGQPVSLAFDSVMRLSFQTPGGLLLRQLHHWAGLLAPASIMVQLLVTFFTGAFRRPRRGSWVALLLLLIVALAAGWSGYALPDDSLSGTGLRIVQGILLSIPLAGTWLSALLFGGGFPGTVIETLHPLHVLITPVLIVVLIAVRARSALRHRPPQFAGGGREEDNVVGVPMLPTAAVRAGGLFAVVLGLLTGIAATVQITPVWLYGPADPGTASAGSQPDWYTGFLDGALRLVPPGWELVLFDRTWVLAQLVPLAVVGLFLLTVAAYPFLEGWISGDRSDHHILDRPRNVATRTGIGVAGMVFFGILWLAAGTDVIALTLGASIESIIHTLQFALLAGPPAAFALTRWVCLGLQRRDRDLVEHGYETGRIVRLPGGEYVEAHRALSAQERWRRSAHVHPVAVGARPDEAGRLPLRERVRAALATRFYAARIDPRPAPSPRPPAPLLPAARERTPERDPASA